MQTEQRLPSDSGADGVPPPSTVGPALVDLADPRAADASLVGGKAAALAIAGSAGLPTLPGVVLTTRFCEKIDGGNPVGGHAAVREAFEAENGRLRSLVARSSSPIEDQATSSMAGQFDSVIGASGLAELEAAVAGFSTRERAPEHPSNPSPCSSSRSSMPFSAASRSGSTP